ncbi:MAG: hypothetical protein ABL903_02750 [Methylococcales bacterium]
MHKYLLHGLGKNRDSFWAYHWYERHAECIKNNMLDMNYKRLRLTTWNAQSKELILLAGLVGLHLPLLMSFPAFICAVYFSMALYYYKHRKAHLNPSWARKHLRWHYEHHLGGDSSANWCVTWPWFDYLLGTRVKNSTLK